MVPQPGLVFVNMNFLRENEKPFFFLEGGCTVWGLPHIPPSLILGCAYPRWVWGACLGTSWSSDAHPSPPGEVRGSLGGCRWAASFPLQ